MKACHLQWSDWDCWREVQYRYRGFGFATFCRNSHGLVTRLRDTQVTQTSCSHQFCRSSRSVTLVRPNSSLALPSTPRRRTSTPFPAHFHHQTTLESLSPRISSGRSAVGSSQRLKRGTTAWRMVVFSCFRSYIHQSGVVVPVSYRSPSCSHECFMSVCGIPTFSSPARSGTQRARKKLGNRSMLRISSPHPLRHPPSHSTNDLPNLIPSPLLIPPPRTTHNLQNYTLSLPTWTKNSKLPW